MADESLVDVTNLDDASAHYGLGHGGEIRNALLRDESWNERFNTKERERLRAAGESLPLIERLRIANERVRARHAAAGGVDHMGDVSSPKATDHDYFEELMRPSLSRENRGGGAGNKTVIRRNRSTGQQESVQQMGARPVSSGSSRSRVKSKSKGPDTQGAEPVEREKSWGMRILQEHKDFLDACEPSADDFISAYLRYSNCGAPRLVSVIESLFRPFVGRIRGRGEVGANRKYGDKKGVKYKAYLRKTTARDLGLAGVDMSRSRKKGQDGRYIDRYTSLYDVLFAAIETFVDQARALGFGDVRTTGITNKQFRAIDERLMKDRGPAFICQKC